MFHRAKGDLMISWVSIDTLGHKSGKYPYFDSMEAFRRGKFVWDATYTLPAGPG